VVSHDTADSIHDLADVNPSRVHLTVPPGFRARAKGVVLHHGELADGDVWDREGYRITTPFRTAIDSAASDLSLEQLTEVVKNVSNLAPHTAPQQLSASHLNYTRVTCGGGREQIVGRPHL